VESGKPLEKATLQARVRAFRGTSCARPPALPRICRVAGAALLGSAAVLVAVPAAVPTCSFDAPTRHGKDSCQRGPGPDAFVHCERIVLD